MTKYLIVKCVELGDQFECDADREPIALVDNWEDWFEKRRPSFMFEVYKYTDGEDGFELVKGYEDNLEEGMALYFWNEGANYEDDDPTVIAHYPNFDRRSPVPEKVMEVFHQGAYWADGEELTEEEFRNDLKCSGYVCWCDEAQEKFWVYGHYEDGRYDCGC